MYRNHRPKRPTPLVRLLGILALMPALGAHARELTLAVQPIMTQAQTRKAYRPLAEYLHHVTGEPVRLVTTPNFLVYWQLMKRSHWDLVLDAAHFTDYRIQKMGYHALAKLPSKVSYTLAVNQKSLVLDPDELIGKPIATLAPPGLGAMRLDSIYPNPVRQPDIIQAANSDDAARKALSGKAAGAMLPTRLLSRYPDLTPIVTSRMVPAPAISAAPGLPADLVARIRHALVDAGKTPRGRAMLKAVNLPDFEPATDKLYAGQAHLLANTWGY